MPLTPEDVSNKRFTPVRLREGYDMGEVDQFLDEVEAELARLTRENEDLRSKLSAAQQASAARLRPPLPCQEKAPEPVKAPEPAPGPRPGRRAAPTETIKVTTVAEASSAAARLLEIATRNADELVGEAKDEADKIVGEARTKAERLEAESKDQVRPARVRRPHPLADARLRDRRASPAALRRPREGEGQAQRARSRTCASFEREYRSRLKSYFQQQLAALDGSGEGGGPRAAATTPRSG